MRRRLLVVGAAACASACEIDSGAALPPNTVAHVATLARPFAPAPQQPPTGGCGDLTYLGTCDGTVRWWCEDGVVQSYDCASAGLVCGWQDDQTGHGCYADATEFPSAHVPPVTLSSDRE